MICSNRLRRTARLGIGPRRQPASRRPGESSVFYPSAGGVRIRCRTAREDRDLFSRCDASVVAKGQGRFENAILPLATPQFLPIVLRIGYRSRSDVLPARMRTFSRSSHPPRAAAGSTGGPTAMVVLQSDATKRACGGSIRARNARVATRAGSVEIAASQLGESNDPALIVPDGVIITRSLFPLPHLAEPVWLESSSGAAVLAGPARALRPYAVDLAPAVRLPSQHAAPLAVLDVRTPRARRQSLWRLVQSTGKPADGWVSRHVNRRISRPISFALLTLGLGPNHASIVTLMAGVWSGLVAIQPGAGPFLASAALFQLASILDGVDGEMARASARESPSGARLDASIDQINYAACFTGVAVGWIREGGGIAAVSWLAALVLLVVLAIARGRRFLALHARDATVATLKRTVVEAARRSGRPTLKLLARGFGLLQTDVFAAIFVVFGFLEHRWLIPAYLTFVFSTAHVALSWYGRELAEAARTDR